jgi:glycolate oxidase FAD binding subunit
MSDAALQSLIDAVRLAAARATPLRIRGGGTKDVLGQSLQGEVLDTTALNGIVAYEPSELVVTVRAGTPLAALEAALAQQGQCLPFEPPRFGAGGTVGGMVAAGLSGPARASVGAVRDYVLGLELVNGRGQALTFGGQVMKNVAGYDVSRLMAGAWGTLGVITAVSLKVLPMAPAEATLKFECDQAEALRRLNPGAASPCRSMPAAGSKMPASAPCTCACAARWQRWKPACRTLGGERQDNARVAADWDACRDQRLPWFAGRARRSGLWRLSVPQTAPVLPLPSGVGAPLVEWHGGQRWVQAGPEHAGALREAASRAGGHATLFIAGDDPSALGIDRFEPLKAPLDRIHRRLKAEFDPSGLFNRGRLYAEL